MRHETNNLLAIVPDSHAAAFGAAGIQYVKSGSTLHTSIYNLIENTKPVAKALEPDQEEFVFMLWSRVVDQCEIWIAG